MALDAGTLQVKIVADNKDATSKINEVTTAVNDVGSATDSMVEKADENTGKVGGFFTGIVDKVSGQSGLGGALNTVLGSLGSVGSVGGAAIGAISAAIAAAIAIINDLKDAADKAAGISDDLITKSAKTGYSTTQLQAMDYAGRFVDTSTDTVISAEKKMVNYMQSAADGTESAQQAFDRLGVSVTNTDGSLRDSKEVMAEVVTALGQIDDYTTRLAAAQDVFGLNNAAEMMPLINAGWEEYLRLQKEAIDNNLILTTYEIEALGRRDDLNEMIAATEEATENKKGAAYAIETGNADAEAELYVKQAELGLISSATDGYNAQHVIDDVHESLNMVSTKDIPELQAGFTQLLTESVNSQTLTYEESIKLAEGFKTVGTNMADGTKEGFLASWPAAAQEILASNSALYNQICALWGIHSPSRKMMDVSKNIVLGMAKGMDDNSSIAVESAEHLSEDVYLHSLIGADLTGNMSMVPNLSGLNSTSTTDSHNNSINVNVNQNNSYGSGSTLMGQHNSNRKLSTMISGAIAATI